MRGHASKCNLLLCIREAEQPAVIEEEHLLTYHQLREKSVQLAQWLNVQGRSPVLVYGHKHPNMIVSLLACLLCNRPWVPCDCSIPYSRMDDVKALRQSDLILLTQPTPDFPLNAVLMEEISVVHTTLPCRCPKQIVYTLYSFGTTGTPKGIPITQKNLKTLIGWLLFHSEIASAGEGVVINQANLSFDFSVDNEGRVVPALPFL